MNPLLFALVDAVYADKKRGAWILRGPWHARHAQSLGWWRSTWG